MEGNRNIGYRFHFHQYIEYDFCCYINKCANQFLPPNCNTRKIVSYFQNKMSIIQTSYIKGQ